MSVATLIPAPTGVLGALHAGASSTPARRPTGRLIAQSRRFQFAAAYARGALANPPARRFYANLAADRAITSRSAAVRDFLHPPVIADIALALYQGQPDDEIIVHATDDAAVVGVTVAIRDRAGRLVEHGAARTWDGVWIYEATAIAPAGQPLTIEVTALDRPGNEVIRRVPWVPGATSSIWNPDVREIA